jgi:hypothetical protein
MVQFIIGPADALEPALSGEVPWMLIRVILFCEPDIGFPDFVLAGISGKSKNLMSVFPLIDHDAQNV